MKAAECQITIQIEHKKVRYVFQYNFEGSRIEMMELKGLCHQRAAPA